MQETLRVCWMNPDGAYNCGCCGKCLATMIGLEAIGARGKIRTFPDELDLGPLRDYRIMTPLQLALWEDVLDAVEESGRADLLKGMLPLIEAGRRTVGGPAVELAEVLGSTSWRLTAPLRRIRGSG